MRRLLGLLVVLLLWPSAARAAFPYDPGDDVVVTGRVTDAAGDPIQGIEVVLEASRLGFRLWPPGREKKQTVRGTAITDTDGDYRLRFDWNYRYNHFELFAGIPVRGRDGESFYPLREIDITRRVQTGSPVVVPIEIGDTDFLTSYRRFVASVDSADERRIFERWGKPDRVEEQRHPSRVDASWWYFDAGKVYRFRGGRLVEEQDFEPVEPL